MQCIKNDKKSKTKKKQYSIALFYICNSGHPSTSDGSDEKVISSEQFECVTVVFHPNNNYSRDCRTARLCCFLKNLFELTNPNIYYFTQNNVLR